MHIRKVVEKDGKVIHTSEFDTESGLTMAEFAKLAYEDFAKKCPDVSMLDDDVWSRWETVR